MKYYTYLFVLLVGVLPFTAAAQLPGGDDPLIEYSSPTEYKIGGITPVGLKYLDPDIIVSLSGLSVGDLIDIPGDDIANTVKNLWRQGLFTNVEIVVTRTVGKTAFLEIVLEERPRLSRFTITGVKKNQSDDLREQIKLIRGRVVTEHIKLNTANIIKKYYYEKGFLNTEVTIIEVDDTLTNNSVTLNIKVDKGPKVKIEQINFEGNVDVSDSKLRRLMKNTREKVHFNTKEMFDRENIREFREYRTVASQLENIAPSRWYEYISNYTNLNIFSASKFIKSEYKGDKQKIVDYYNAMGYKDARIVRDSIYDIDNTLIGIDIWVEEGNQYYLRNIEWKGNTKYDDTLLTKILNLKVGDIYDQNRIDERLFMSQTGNDISSLYMDDGYLFFQVTPVEVAVTEDSVDIEIRIYEGPQATINEVRIYGNTKTKEHVVRREIRTLPGAKFSRSDLIRSQREIINLGYFDPEQMEVTPIPNPADGTVDIEYHVVEQPSDQLELSAGWGGRGRGVVGTLGISFTNFSIQNMFKKGSWSPLPTGDGQKLSLRVQTNGKIFQSYNISFTEPWLGGKKPNSLTVSYFHSRFADLDAERNVEGRLISNGASIGIGTRLKWPDDFFTFQALVNFENYVLDNWNSQSFIITDGSSNNFSLEFILARNSATPGKSVVYPERGSNISLSLQLTPPYSAFSNKDYSTLSDNEKYKWIEYHKWKFKAEWFVKLTKSNKFPIVLRTSAKFGFLGLYNQGIGYSPFERFELGGDGIANFNFNGREIIALRGYDVFTPNEGAPFYNKFTMEMRFPFSLNPSATIWAHAFVEGGNAWGSIKDYNPFDLRRTAGIGVRIFLPMFGMLGFDYGIGFDKDLPPASNFGDLLGRYGKFSIVLGFEPE